MKIFLLTILALLISAVSIAQNGINYKALIKDANGDVVENQAVTIQFQILEGGTTNVYQETHNPITDINGIIAIKIGEGTIDSGDFLTIDWGTDDYFLDVQVDTGTGLTNLGTTQFGTVPYALMAESLKNPPIDVSQFSMAKAYSTTGNFGGPSTNLQIGNFNGEVFDLTNNYSTSTRTFTVSQEGYYNINTQVYAIMSSTSNNDPQVKLFIYKNGASIKTASMYKEDSMMEDTVTISSVEYLEVGDTIRMYVQLLDGVDLQGGANAINNSFLIERIR